MQNLLEEIAVEIHPTSSVAALMKLDDLRKVKDKIAMLKERVFQERLRHQRELDALNLQIASAQLECHHERTKQHPDPSGNNDSFTECLICGKEM